MTRTSIYGVTVDLNEPVGGVTKIHDVDFEEQDSIDLAWEEYETERDAVVLELQAATEWLEHRIDYANEDPPLPDILVQKLRELYDELFQAAKDLSEDNDVEGYGDDLNHPSESGKQLLGSWQKDADGKYEPDINNGEYAAIYNPDRGTIQVVWSKYVRFGVQHCSPCYPGQADLGTYDPEQYAFIAYDFPPEMLRTPKRQQGVASWIGFPLLDKEQARG